MVDFSAIGNLSFGKGSIAGVGGGFFIIIVIIYAIHLWIQRSSESISGSEELMDREVGLGNIAGSLKWLIRHKHLEAGEERAFGRGAGLGLNIAKAAASEGGVEKATAALEVHSSAIIASVEAMLKYIEEYLKTEKSKIQLQLKGMNRVYELTETIKDLEGRRIINTQVAGYLKNLFKACNRLINDAVDSEKSKEHAHRELLAKLKIVAKAATDGISKAKILLRDLLKAERKERKSFKREIRDIKEAIKAKKKELKITKSSKESSTDAISQLRKEIKLLRKNLAVVAMFNKQLKRIYKVMAFEDRKIKLILKSISLEEKQVKRYERDIGRREKALGSRCTILKKIAGELEKIPNKYKDPYALAKHFSGGLGHFYKIYAEIITGDQEFDNGLRRILVRSINMATQMYAYNQFSQSLTQAEDAVNEILAKATEWISTIAKGDDQRANIKRLLEDIKKAGGENDYAARVSEFLKQLTLRIKEKTSIVTNQINQLLEEDTMLAKEIEAANERNSGYIGEAMAAMENRIGQIKGSGST
ncbi:hypothetical protein KY347_06590 [Candidatus Woesearchaeota archaeon]|nr:hypothetical protein [Candidatus Woesearchaeota archaeon]